jgi:hypothetical protein
MDAEAQRRHDNAWETIVGWAYDYLEGGPNPRDDALALARVEGIEAARVNAAWDEVEADKQAQALGSATAGIRQEQKAKIEAEFRREASGNFLKASAHAEKKILTEPQPEAEAPPPEQPAKPSGSIYRFARTKPEEKQSASGSAVVRIVAEAVAKHKEDRDEPEVEGDGPAFEDEEPDFDAGAPVLSSATPYDNAKVYARRNCFRDGVLALRYWHEKFWQWNGNVYAVLNDSDLRASVYKFLDGAEKNVYIGTKEEPGKWRLDPFQPKPRHVNELIDGLKGGLAMPNHWDPPMWLDTRRKAAEVLTFANGVLNIRT